MNLETAASLTGFKLNACTKHQASNERILRGLVLQGYSVDRFGHAKKTTTDGKIYRYKFQHHTIRFEIQVNHAATSYGKASKEWLRLKTLKYSGKA